MRSQKQIKRTHRVRATRNAAACKRKAYRKRIEAKQVWQNSAIFTGFRLNTPSAPASHPHKGKEPKQRSPEEIAERQRNREQKRIEKQLAKQKASTSAVPKPKNVKKERRAHDEQSQKKLQPKLKKERAKTVVEEVIRVVRVKPTDAEITAKKLAPTESSAAKPKAGNKNYDVVSTDKAAMHNDLKTSGAAEGAESAASQKLSKKKAAKNQKSSTAAVATEPPLKDEISEKTERYAKAVTKLAEAVSVKADGQEEKSKTKNSETASHMREKQKHEKSAKGAGSMAAENREKKRLSSHQDHTPKLQEEIVIRNEKHSAKNKTMDVNGNHSLEHGLEFVEVATKSHKEGGGDPKSEKRNEVDEKQDVVNDSLKREGTPKGEAAGEESPTFGNLGKGLNDKANVHSTGVKGKKAERKKSLDSEETSLAERKPEDKDRNRNEETERHIKYEENKETESGMRELEQTEIHVSLSETGQAKTEGRSKTKEARNQQISEDGKEGAAHKMTGLTNCLETLVNNSADGLDAETMQRKQLTSDCRTFGGHHVQSGSKDMNCEIEEALTKQRAEQQDSMLNFQRNELQSTGQTYHEGFPKDAEDVRSKLFVNANSKKELQEASGEGFKSEGLAEEKQVIEGSENEQSACVGENMPEVTYFTSGADMVKIADREKLLVEQNQKVKEMEEEDIKKHAAKLADRQPDELDSSNEPKSREQEEPLDREERPAVNGSSPERGLRLESFEGTIKEPPLLKKTGSDVEKTVAAVHLKNEKEASDDTVDEPNCPGQAEHELEGDERENRVTFTEDVEESNHLLKQNSCKIKPDERQQTSVQEKNQVKEELDRKLQVFQKDDKEKFTELLSDKQVELTSVGDENGTAVTLELKPEEEIKLHDKPAFGQFQVSQSTAKEVNERVADDLQKKKEEQLSEYGVCKLQLVEDFGNETSKSATGGAEIKQLEITTPEHSERNDSPVQTAQVTGSLSLANGESNEQEIVPATQEAKVMPLAQFEGNEQEDSIKGRQTENKKVRKLSEGMRNDLCEEDVAIAPHPASDETFGEPPGAPSRNFESGKTILKEMESEKVTDEENENRNEEWNDKTPKILSSSLKEATPGIKKPEAYTCVQSKENCNLCIEKVPEVQHFNDDFSDSITSSNLPEVSKNEYSTASGADLPVSGSVNAITNAVSSAATTQVGHSSIKDSAPSEPSKQSTKRTSERVHDGMVDANKEAGSVEEVIPPPVLVSCCPCEGPEHITGKTIECITLSTGDVPKDHEVVEKTVVSIDSSSPAQFSENVAKLMEAHPELMAKTNLDFGENTNAKMTITTYTKKVPEAEPRLAVKREPVILALQREKKPAQARPMRERVYKLLPRDIQFCTRMIETYGDDYEAMAKDQSNVYQETAKSIQRKIRIFRESPQYEVYARSKESSPVPLQG